MTDKRATAVIAQGSVSAGPGVASRRQVPSRAS